MNAEYELITIEAARSLVKTTSGAEPEIPPGSTICPHTPYTYA